MRKSSHCTHLYLSNSHLHLLLVLLEMCVEGVSVELYKILDNISQIGRDMQQRVWYDLGGI